MRQPRGPLTHRAQTHLADDPLRMALHRYLMDLGRFYGETPALAACPAKSDS